MIAKLSNGRIVELHRDIVPVQFDSTRPDWCRISYPIDKRLYFRNLNPYVKENTVSNNPNQVVLSIRQMKDVLDALRHLTDEYIRETGHRHPEKIACVSRARSAAEAIHWALQQQLGPNYCIK